MSQTAATCRTSRLADHGGSCAARSTLPWASWSQSDACPVPSHWTPFYPVSCERSAHGADPPGPWNSRHVVPIYFMPLGRLILPSFLQNAVRPMMPIRVQTTATSKPRTLASDCDICAHASTRRSRHGSLLDPAFCRTPTYLYFRLGLTGHPQLGAHHLLSSPLNGADPPAGRSADT